MASPKSLLKYLSSSEKSSYFYVVMAVVMDRSVKAPAFCLGAWWTNNKFTAKDVHRRTTIHNKRTKKAHCMVFLQTEILVCWKHKNTSQAYIIQSWAIQEAFPYFTQHTWLWNPVWIQSNLDPTNFFFYRDWDDLTAIGTNLEIYSKVCFKKFFFWKFLFF